MGRTELVLDRKKARFVPNWATGRASARPYLRLLLSWAVGPVLRVSLAHYGRSRVALRGGGGLVTAEGLFPRIKHRQKLALGCQIIF